ncbi:MAG: hypothetical protein KAI18_01545 [Candidatus Aenigmarchaeota archaeon]|nr:hypothetical protein [Candidatus Aenigmarchaeota archaeon]
MKKMKSLNLTIFAIIMSLLYTAVSVFAADVVGSQAISISNPFGFLSNLFTQDTAIVLFAAISISAFLVAALEWFGILKSAHYWRNIISFSFVGFFLIMVTGGPALIAGYGVIFFYVVGAMFIVGIFGAFLVKHFKQKKAWQTDKIETDLQNDSFKATQGVVVGMVDELQDLRKELQTDRNELNEKLKLLTAGNTPDVNNKIKMQIAEITERIKDKEAREHRILSVQEAMKKKFEKDTLADVDTLIN